MFELDVRDIDKLERQLETFNKRGIPYATRECINKSAFHAQKISRQMIESDFINRNHYTKQSVRVDMSRTLDTQHQYSVVGSDVEWMERQEFGGRVSKKGDEGHPIATSYAAGQRRAKSRTKLPTRRNKLKTIALSKKGKRTAKNNKQSLVFKVQDAVDSGDRVIFHDFGEGKSRGIFRVVGGKSGYKRSWPKRTKLQMLYNLSRDSVTTPKKPWLKPSVLKTKPMMEEFYYDALQYQIDKLQLF